MSKTSKKLRRELEKNPVKTAVLAIACGIAVWYWAPLLSGIVSSQDPSSLDDLVVNPATVTASYSSVVLSPAVVATAAAPDQHSWRNVAAWIAQDPLRQTVAVADAWPNPFVGLTEEEVPVLPEPEEADQAESRTDESWDNEVAAEEELAPAIDIRQLDLVLKGTVVSRYARLATVNGKTYREGQLIDVATGVDTDDGAADESIRIELIAVYPRYVLLGHESGQRRLNLKASRLGRGDEIASLHKSDSALDSDMSATSIGERDGR